MVATSSHSSDRQAAGIDLCWIPLGAGGSGFLRFNGRVYETIQARLQRRRPVGHGHQFRKWTGVENAPFWLLGAIPWQA